MNLFEIRLRILSNGFTGFHFCSFESGNEETIQHYNLMQPGEVTFEGCIEQTVTPLISEAGDSLLESYILGQVVIHPDPKSL